ncbi:MAG: sugar ABC transporter ATP-binding protein [Verrucomicrobia bacterium]|nr:sugar ABC transporter ATP-binding protein [Verrucomicrobiota bacterium]
MAEATPLLAITGLSKAYAAPVLTDVSLDILPGEVHALVGENGAGKSTLSRIVAGLTPADAGELRLRGAPYRPRGKADAERHGIRMVMQELNLVGTLTVAENLFLPSLPRRWGCIDYPRLHHQAREALARVGLDDLNPSRPVHRLGVGQQQLVEIAAGLSRRCDLLILDEPTAALTDPEIERLFTQIARLTAAGTAVLYISHRLEEIQRVARRISILRDGRLVATRNAQTVPLDEVVRLMVGRTLEPAAARQPRSAGPPALQVRGLNRGAAVRDVSFDVRQGEILGFAGLMGSGRTETMRAVFGADRADRGAVFLRGSTRPARIRSPRDAVRHGLALLTENRKEQGLLLSLSVRANITLLCLGRLSRAGTWIRGPRERDAARHWTRALSVRCHSLEQPVAELSGGNQQKVLIAKWLFRDCDVLIFDEPTRGIDVGARFDIYALLDQLAAQGKAIVVVSSDLKELLALCDRIAVMSAGRLAGTFRRGEWTQDNIMAAALSGYRGADGVGTPHEP